MRVSALESWCRRWVDYVFTMAFDHDPIEPAKPSVVRLTMPTHPKRALMRFPVGSVTAHHNAPGNPAPTGMVIGKKHGPMSYMPAVADGIPEHLNNGEQIDTPAEFVIASDKEAVPAILSATQVPDTSSIWM